MKFFVSLFAAICICLSLTACAAAPAPAETPAPTAEAQPLPVESAAPAVEYSKDDYFDRVLSDDELEALKDADLNTLRSEISTIGDAVAFLDGFSPACYSNIDGEINLQITFLYDLHTRPEATFTQTYAAFAAWCLCDDYEDIKYVICIGENQDSCRVIPALALPVSGGWYVCAPWEDSTLLDEDSGHGLVPVELESLDALQDKLFLELSNPMAMQIFLAEANQPTLQFSLDMGGFSAKPTVGEAETVYTVSPEYMEGREQSKRRQAVENLDKLELPGLLAASLSKDDISALIGRDADTVAAELKTLGDVLYYLALSGYHTTDGDIKIWEGELCWSMNEAPRTVFANNAGNCGGTAALVPFLLEGDYEEAGCLSMTCDVEIGGGHVISYIKSGSTCYVFDPRGVVDTNYTWDGGISTGGDVRSAGTAWRSNVDETYKLIFAYPTVTGDLPGMGDGKTVYLPEQYRDIITVVYEADNEGYRFDWRSIGENALRQMEVYRSSFTQLPNTAEAADGGSAVSIDRSGDYFTPLLSAEELEALKDADLYTLQAWISTVADTVAFLDQYNNPFNNAMSDCFAVNLDNFLMMHKTLGTSPDVYTVLCAFFLADDYPEAQIIVGSVSDMGHSRYRRCHYALLLPEGDGYCVVNPSTRSAYDSCIYGFQEISVGSTDELADALVPYTLDVPKRDSKLKLESLYSLSAHINNVRFGYENNVLLAPAEATELYTEN